MRWDTPPPALHPYTWPQVDLDESLAAADPLAGELEDTGHAAERVWQVISAKYPNVNHVRLGAGNSRPLF